jgi:ABC-2 type transport system permease protein
MRHVPTLVRRELAAYFLGPMAYLVLVGFQFVAAFNFFQLVALLSQFRNEYSGLRDPMNSYIAGSVPFWIAMIVAIPALTMRLLAEERRSGTIETLLTAPVTETEVVLSKWFAGLVMYLVLLVPFALYLPILRHYGRFPFDLGPMLATAIGLTTMGMMFVAMGLFFSALTRHQIVAAVGTFAGMFALVLVTMIAAQAAASQGSEWSEALRFVSLVSQAFSFGAGQLDLRYLALHVSATVFLLYLTVKAVEFSRGR